MELASSDAMAARFALPVLHGPLFLWRLDTVSFSKVEKEMGSKSFLSPNRERQEWGANFVSISEGKRKEKNGFKKRFSGKRIEIILKMIKKDFL